MNKKQLSERDICTKFITPVVAAAGWDSMSQLREEVSFTRGRVIVGPDQARPAGDVALVASVLMARAGARDHLLERAYGAGKPGLNLENIRSLPLYVPPLEEQRAILAELDRLMEVCDRLESPLAVADRENKPPPSAESCCVAATWRRTSASPDAPRGA